MRVIPQNITRLKSGLKKAAWTFIRRKHSMRHLFRPAEVNPNSADDCVRGGGSPVTKSSTDAESKSSRLMTQLGLIKSSSTGTYHILPVAQRSLEKLTRIIDHFMRTIEAQKVQLPTLTPRALWERTGRIHECESELIEVTDRHLRKYLLSPTHEESICDLLSDTRLSHKQLPLRMYQITSKFRDEMRPRFGLLRAREFLMKDLYTFDKDKESAELTYEQVNMAYAALFDYIGVKWIKALGSGGTIGGDTTHEYHFVSAAGEDEIMICSNCSEHFNKEFLNARVEKVDDQIQNGSDNQKPSLQCPKCASTTFERLPGIEVGHSFLLGRKYTKPMKNTFINPGGKPVLMEMGCYGLGVSRILASVIEVLSTSTEIRWPLSLAPFSLAIITPKSGSKEEAFGLELADKLFHYLEKLLPNDVLVDDRTEFTIGRRFTDIKQMGIPYAIVLGKRLTERPSIVEFHDVYNGHVTDLTKDEIFNYSYDLKSKWNLI